MSAASPLGFPVAPPGAAPPVTVSEIPSPWDAPDLWGTVLLTLPDGSQATLPTDPREGVCFVEIDTKVDVDKKQSSGQGANTQQQRKPQKAETTVKKIDPSKVVLRLQWTSRIDPAMRAQLQKIHPNGPNGGQPLDAMNPEFDQNSVKRILIESLGKVKREGQLYSLEIDASEWNPPPPAAPGDGADTPSATDGGHWSASYGNSKPGSQNGAGWSGAMNGTGAKGFGGPNSPKAAP